MYITEKCPHLQMISSLWVSNMVDMAAQAATTTVWAE